MNYKSLANLSHDIKMNLHKIPQDVSLIVGTHQSSLLAANLLALFLNVPFTDIDRLTRGEILTAGLRAKASEKSALQGRILVMEDSVFAEEVLSEAKVLLTTALAAEKYLLSYCSVYVTAAHKSLVDIPLVVLEKPLVLEWNIFNKTVLENACVDIDGVICVNPEYEDNDDGVLYSKFINTARPFILPKVKIQTLVTSRLEKYRPATVEWLKRNGIAYEELIMLNLPDRAARKKMNNQGEYKAGEYTKRADALLFIESSKKYSQKIFELTGRNVFCVDTNQLYTKETYPELMKPSRQNSGVVSKAKKLVRKVASKFS